MHRSALRRFVMPEAMTGLDVLILDLSLCPPPSKYYGAETDRFRLSAMYDFQEKAWQLRTVQFEGKYFVAPFIVNSGGPSNVHPIVCTNLLKKVGALPTGDRAVYNDSVTMPSPLGELRQFNDWPTHHLSKLQETVQSGKVAPNDCRYNLYGHQFALFTAKVDERARDVLNGEISVEGAVEKLIRNCPREKGFRNYIQNPQNKWRVRRELEAYMAGIEAEETVSFEALAEQWGSEESN